MTTLAWDAQPAGLAWDAQPGGAVRRPAGSRAGLPSPTRKAFGGSNLRLTRRGRVVAAVLGTVLTLTAALSAQSAAAGSPADAVPVRALTVAAGQTLWDIAGSVAAQGEDPRDVVAKLMELNGLTDGALVAGQQIFVPAH